MIIYSNQRERYWDETVEEYECAMDHKAEHEWVEHCYRIYNLGWLAGVPEDVLDQVQSELRV